MGSKIAGEELESINFDDPRLTESCWWETQTSGTVEISLIRALEIATRIRPTVVTSWQLQLTKITSAQINEIIDRIPNNLITPTSAKFAKDLLTYNRTQILNFKLINHSKLEQKSQDLADLNSNPEATKLIELPKTIASKAERKIREIAQQSGNETAVEQVNVDTPIQIIKDPSTNKGKVELTPAQKELENRIQVRQKSADSKKSAQKKTDGLAQ